MCLTFTPLHWLFATVNSSKKRPSCDNQTYINVTLKKLLLGFYQGFQAGMDSRRKDKIKQMRTEREGSMPCPFIQWALASKAHALQVPLV
jgi:hypothetical protein